MNSRMKMPELPGDPGCPVKALPWFRITLGTGGPGAPRRPLEGLPHSPPHTPLTCFPHRASHTPFTHAPIHSPHALHHTTPDIIPHRVSHTLLPRPLSTLPPRAPLTPSLTHSLTCSVTPSFTHSVISQPSSGASSHPKNADSSLQTKTPGWVWIWCPWRDSSLEGHGDGWGRASPAPVSTQTSLQPESAA